jgi:hypothetical protein
MPGLLRGVARTAVIAGTATSVSNRVSRRQAARWGEQESYAEPQPPPPPAPAAAASSDPVQRLTELAELRDRGALTDQEFATMKQQILAG